MRIIATFVVLIATGIAAVGCATGLQGLAVLASMRHGGTEPAFSEFAAEASNYSPDTTDGVAGNMPLEPLAATIRQPAEPDYGFVSVSDHGVTGADSGVSDSSEVPLQPVGEDASPEPSEAECSILDEPVAVEPAGPSAELAPQSNAPPASDDSPTRSPFESPFDSAYEVAAEDGSTVAPAGEFDPETEFEPAAEVEPETEFEAAQESEPAAKDNALAMGADEGASYAQGPRIDDATGYPVALSQEELHPGPGEAIATPQPDAYDSDSDDPDIDRFNRRLADVPLDIRPTQGVMPGDPAAARFAEIARIDPRETNQVPGIVCSCTPWTICYRPLYFEEVALERYGDKARCIQPVISGVRFFSTVALLPYKMRVRPPRSCVCDNGFSRPGDCPLPGYCDCVWRWDAAAIEIAAVTGFVFILP